MFSLRAGLNLEISKLSRISSSRLGKERQVGIREESLGLRFCEKVPGWKNVMRLPIFYPSKDKFPCILRSVYKNGPEFGPNTLSRFKMFSSCS